MKESCSDLNSFPRFFLLLLKSRRRERILKLNFQASAAFHSRTRIFHFRYFIFFASQIEREWESEMNFFIIMHHKWLKSTWDLIRIFLFLLWVTLVDRWASVSSCVVSLFALIVHQDSLTRLKMWFFILRKLLCVYILRKRIRKMAFCLRRRPNESDQSETRKFLWKMTFQKLTDRR